MQDWQHWAEGCAGRFWLKYQNQFPKHKIGDVPKFILNKRLRSTYGRAWVRPDMGIIDLAYNLMLKHPVSFQQIVIPHELCHFIALRVHGDWGHGPQWKNTMRSMGLESSRFITLDK